jgi:hypothetical protein
LSVVASIKGPLSLHDRAAAISSPSPAPQLLLSCRRDKRRRVELPARQNKLRSFDSELQISDSSLRGFDSRTPFATMHVIWIYPDVPATHFKLRSFDSNLCANDS